MGLRPTERDEKRRVLWQLLFLCNEPSPFCHSERSEESAVRHSGAPNLKVYSHLSLCHPDLRFPGRIEIFFDGAKRLTISRVAEDFKRVVEEPVLRLPKEPRRCLSADALQSFPATNY